VTVNPYSPPTGSIEPAGEPVVPKSFARRLSFILAAAGFVAFWGGGLLIAANGVKNGLGVSLLLFGVLILLAVVAHLVGVAIIFAAPRGRRLLPALLNGVSLAIMVAVSVWGFFMPPG
jgi:hypothetical protein